MQRVGKYFIYRGIFHNFTGIHYGHIFRRLGNNPEIMGDQNYRHIIFLFQIRNQIQNLRLNGYIQCGCGFIGQK